MNARARVIQFDNGVPVREDKRVVAAKIVDDAPVGRAEKVRPKAYRCGVCMATVFGPCDRCIG